MNNDMNKTVGYHNKINSKNNIEEDLFFIRKIKNSPSAKKIVTQPIHRHPFYEIIFVTEGELSIEVDFKEYTLKKGTMTLFFPLQIHHPKKVSEDYESVLIRFYPTLFENADFFKEIKVFDYDVISLKEPEYIKAKLFVEELNTEYNENLSFKELALSNLLKYFLINIQRSLPQTISEKSYESTFSKLNYLIVENNFKITKPSDYASELRISPRALNEVVKKHTGFSAGEYIRSKTIFEAQRLLYYTSLTIKEIAYELGFDDIAYFSRFFKKATNTSALQYREEYLALNEEKNNKAS
ncbi:helix-turn-helix domain-containing protein [Arcobacter sp.]|uniref:helix-turn-helix domain-containing protein n=1 Tax=Arcobacter sp. TaxID=1872629 RepID=UPI003C7070C9